MLDNRAIWQRATRVNTVTRQASREVGFGWFPGSELRNTLPVRRHLTPERLRSGRSADALKYHLEKNCSGNPPAFSANLLLGVTLVNNVMLINTTCICFCFANGFDKCAYLSQFYDSIEIVQFS